MRGERVRIGHLDTGVDETHHALRGAVHSFAGDGFDGALRASLMGTDRGGHGTRSAGVMVARAVGSHAGGCAPAAALCSAAVIEGRRSLLRVLAGVDWLLDQEVHIACLALGTDAVTPIFDGALEALARRGALVVAAVGNGGSGTSTSPADRGGVLAVGAVDEAGRVPRFSAGRSLAGSARTLPDLVAPGVDVVTTEAGGGYVTASGTSIAAAWVSGVAALLLEAHPRCSPAALAEALVAGARPVAGAAPHRAGRGVVDPEASLGWLDAGAAPRSRPPDVAGAGTMFFDPRLQVQIAMASEDAVLEALVLGRGSGIGGVVRGLAAEVGGSTPAVVELTRLRTVFVRARVELLRRVSAAPEVEALSAPDTFARLTAHADPSASPGRLRVAAHLVGEPR